MLFKDRVDAGKKLTNLLKKKFKKIDYVVSLLRGGVIVGREIADNFKVPNVPLPVAKIPHPFNSELAIGALCFDKIYWENENIPEVFPQIKIAKEKFRSYLKRFHLKKTSFKNIKNKTVILVDDGIATGATVKAGLMFLKSQYPKKIILAVPVAPADFKNPSFDEIIVFRFDPFFSAVSQFYKNFPQVDDDEIKRLLY